VLYLYQHFSTPSGATGTRAYEMAKRLVAEGHEVTMVCGRVDTADTGVEVVHGQRIARAQVEGIKVVQLDFRYSNRDSLVKRAWMFVRYSASASRIALTHKYDLVFATSTPLTAAIPGVAARLVRRKPFVFEVRDLWPDLPIALGGLSNPLTAWTLKMLERTAYRCADVCIGLAPGISEAIADRSRHDNVEMIPNGSDIDLFRPRERPLVHTGGDKSPFRAVFTGTHGIANGLDAVLDCAEELLKAGRDDIELHLIGGGNQKELLTAEAARRSLSNVHFHAHVSKLELADLLPTYDAGLMILANVPAFYYGTSPNKFFDYIAAGLPVVTNYPGWLAELITDNDCGVAAKPEDAKSIAAALTGLADNSAKSERKGSNSRTLAERSFARPELAGQFITALERAANIRSHR